MPLFATQPERCGTKQPGVDELAAIERGIAKGQKGKPSAIIPVWVHVINKGAGFDNGDVSDTMIRNQIRVLNDAYNGRTGGANTSFGFELEGVTRTTNATWSAGMATDINIELAARSALRKGGGETLNFYVTDASPYLGFAYFPSILNDPNYANLNGVLVDWRSLPGGTFAIYSEGDTGRTKWATGWRCITRSTASAETRATTSPIRRPNSRPRSSARWDATVAQERRSPA